MKSLHDLLCVDSSWWLILDMAVNTGGRFKILPRNPKNAEHCIIELGQSVASIMGAVTYESGGIIIDGGWLRVLGSGSEKLKRNIIDWNIGRSYDAGETPGYIMFADDVIGGLYALNGTELGGDTGKVYYLPPSTLKWESMGITLHGFMEACFFGDLEINYTMTRWNDWQTDCANTTGDEVIFFDPPLWEEQPLNINNRKRRVISSEKAYTLFLDAAEAMSNSIIMQ
jgi:hypothetical protein